MLGEKLFIFLFFMFSLTKCFSNIFLVITPHISTFFLTQLMFLALSLLHLLTSTYLLLNVFTLVCLLRHRTNKTFIVLLDHLVCICRRDPKLGHILCPCYFCTSTFLINHCNPHSFLHILKVK